MKCRCGQKTNSGCRRCPACSREQRTLRRHQVVGLWADGLNDKTIADQMSISPKTVQWHLMQVRRENRITSLQALVKWAVRAGLTALCLALVGLQTPNTKAQTPGGQTPNPNLQTPSLPPLPSAVVVPSEPAGACAYLAWDYPTNGIGGSNGIAGFTVGWGLSPLYAALTNTVTLGISTLTGTPTNGGSWLEFTNRVCGFTNYAAYFFRVLAYDAYGNKSDWSNDAAWTNAAPRTNRVVLLTVLSNSVLAGWVRDARWPQVWLTNPPGPQGWWKLQAVEGQ